MKIQANKYLTDDGGKAMNQTEVGVNLYVIVNLSVRQAVNDDTMRGL